MTRLRLSSITALIFFSQFLVQEAQYAHAQTGPRSTDYWIHLDIKKEPIGIKLDTALKRLKTYPMRVKTFGKGDGEIGLSDPASAHTECLLLNEIEHVVTCIFNLKIFMNLSMGRPFIKSTGHRSTDSSHLEFRALNMVEGLTLRPNAIISYLEDLDPKLVQLRDGAKSELPMDYVSSALGLETAFITSLAEPLAKENYVIIGLYERTDLAELQNDFSHELFHTQWNFGYNYRYFVLKFWNEIVSETDRGLILKDLDDMGYHDFPPSEMVIDEFQAFMLQADSFHNPLSYWSQRYSKSLRLWLSNAGVKIFDPFGANFKTVNRLR